MPIRVEGPDGVTLEFPDGTSQETMRAAMQRRYGAPRQQTRPENPGNYARIGGRPFGGPGGTRPPPPPSGFQRAYQREAALHGSGTQQRPRVPVVSDFNDMISQIPANIGIADDLAGLSARGGQSIENLVRRVQGRPIDITADEAGNAAGQEALDRAQRYRQQNPGGDAMATALSIPALLGTPGGAAGAAVPAWRAGAAAAAMDAPFALARQEGDLGERLPGAAQEVATMGILGTALQGGANLLTRTRQPLAQAPRMIDRFERAGVTAGGAQPRGVTPSLAAINEGVGMMGPTTNMVGDDILGGALVRGRVRRALTETRDAAHDIRDAYGRARSPEGAGGMVQQRVEQFSTERGLPNPRPGQNPRTVSVRDWSAASKSEAVFDHALRPVQSNPAQLTETQAALSQIMRQADDPAVRAFQADPTIRQFTETLRKINRAGRQVTLRDLRELRTKIRTARDTPVLGQTRDNAALGQIESALTRDMYAAAGPASRELQLADAYYRRWIARRDDVLATFAPGSRDPSEAFQAIIRAANARTANTRALVTLRQALKGDQWRSLVASVIEHMGTPRPGASGFTTQLGFSLDRFATEYFAMSPAARRVLFGSRGGRAGAAGALERELADDLDNLAQVARAQKGVERGANFSGSGRDVNNGLTVLAGATGGVPAAATKVGAFFITGEMLTNPTFVRWLTSASKNGVTPGGIRQHLSALATIAARDPAVAPFYTELTQRLSGQSQPRTQQQQPQPEPVQ